MFIISVFYFAPERARRLAAECPEIKQSQQVRAADHGSRKGGESRELTEQARAASLDARAA
jgi:hypothetical protein